MDGRLDADDIIDLMEEAVEGGRTEKLKQLITYAAENETHDVRRLLCQSEYQIMKGRPALALASLDDAHKASASEQQRKEIWMRTVTCQRLMRDFDAAHLTLVKLSEQHPGCPEVDRMAKLNYKEYLESHCADATALEKVTSLDGDS